MTNCVDRFTKFSDANDLLYTQKPSAYAKTSASHGMRRREIYPSSTSFMSISFSFPLSFSLYVHFLRSFLLRLSLLSLFYGLFHFPMSRRSFFSFPLSFSLYVHFFKSPSTFFLSLFYSLFLFFHFIVRTLFHIFLSSSFSS